jgi:hypothetical protein
MVSVVGDMLTLWREVNEALRFELQAADGTHTSLLLRVVEVRSDDVVFQLDTEDSAIRLESLDGLPALGAHWLLRQIELTEQNSMVCRRMERTTGIRSGPLLLPRSLAD